MVVVVFGDESEKRVGLRCVEVWFCEYCCDCEWIRKKMRFGCC